MATERTLSIIKPDATRRNLTGKINAIFEGAGLSILAQKRLQLTRAQAEAFYGVHRERGFFNDLVSFMISGPVLAQVLSGENAVVKNRELMGATDPKKAEAGTIRAQFAESIEANKTHIKYKDVDVGIVRRVTLTKDHREVEVTAEMRGNSGIENLLVTDGAAIPANPGVNPSLTITAKAEHAMSLVPPKAGEEPRHLPEAARPATPVAS